MGEWRFPLFLTSALAEAGKVNGGTSEPSCCSPIFPHKKWEMGEGRIGGKTMGEPHNRKRLCSRMSWCLYLAAECATLPIARQASEPIPLNSRAR
jgi:hypothetical protein